VEQYNLFDLNPLPELWVSLGKDVAFCVFAGLILFRYLLPSPHLPPPLFFIPYIRKKFKWLVYDLQSVVFSSITDLSLILEAIDTRLIITCIIWLIEKQSSWTWHHILYTLFSCTAASATRHVVGTKPSWMFVISYCPSNAICRRN